MLWMSRMAPEKLSARLFAHEKDTSAIEKLKCNLQFKFNLELPAEFPDMLISCLSPS